MSLRGKLLLTEAIPQLFTAINIDGIAAIVSTLPRNDKIKTGIDALFFYFSRR
jgi:hypothetical protein